MIIVLLLLLIFAVGCPLEAFGLMLTIPELHSVVPQVDYAHPGYFTCLWFSWVSTLAFLPLIAAGAIFNEFTDAL